MNFIKNMLSALLRGFASFARRSGDLVKAAALEAQAVSAEAVQPLVDRLPALGTGLAYAGAGVAFAAGKVLGIPGAVLRSVLPAGEPTAAQVADAAVVNDSAAQATPRAAKPTFASYIQAAASALSEHDYERADRLTQHVTEPVMQWLRSLTPPQLRIIQTMDRSPLEEHIMLPGTVTPGLPRFDQVKAGSTMTPEERRRIVAAATASLRDAEAHNREVTERAREQAYRALAPRPAPSREIIKPSYGYGM